MTRSERKQKLANAIKQYRGAYDVKSGKWIIAPEIKKRRQIVDWLLKLGRTHDQIEADAVAIDGFKTRAEFEAWMEAL